MLCHCGDAQFSRFMPNDYLEKSQLHLLYVLTSQRNKTGVQAIFKTDFCLYDWISVLFSFSFSNTLLLEYYNQISACSAQIVQTIEVLSLSAEHFSRKFIEEQC